MTRFVGLVFVCAVLVTMAVVAYKRPSAPKPEPSPDAEKSKVVAAKSTSPQALTAIPLRFLGQYRKTSGPVPCLTMEVTSSMVITTGPKFGSPGEISEERRQPTAIVVRPDDSLALTMVFGELTWIEILALTDTGVVLYREAEGTTVELGRFERH